MLPDPVVDAGGSTVVEAAGGVLVDTGTIATVRDVRWTEIERGAEAERVGTRLAVVVAGATPTVIGLGFRMPRSHAPQKKNEGPDMGSTASMQGHRQ